ncbi:MAG: LysR family transcriptional regulator [bacterium]|nr:LysR family transcriptional regulator [bacterium]
MDYIWFRDLDNLACTGNFSRAAKLGNISQPAFSRRIKAIENWVGVSLVDRSQQPVVLTSAGKQMLEAGQQALARLETERNHIREAHSLPDKYIVTFGAQHSIGWRFYPAWLQAFEHAFGPIISRLRTDDLPNCLKDLKAGELDFVIAYNSEYSNSVITLPNSQSVLIGQDRLIPVCKPRSDGLPIFDFENKTSLKIPSLRFGANAPISEHIEPLLEANNLNNRLSVVYENSMAGALRIRAREGIGVAWLPKSLVAPDIEAGLLVQTGEAIWETKLEIHLYRLHGNLNQLTRKIWAFLSVRESVPLVTEL